MLVLIVMLFATKPSDGSIERFLADQTRAAFSYEQVGATRREVPPGYYRHDVETKLGRGRRVFHAAKKAIVEWAPFDTEWTEAFVASQRLEPGTTVAILARIAGLWSLNAGRIVYVIDEPRLFGFGFGTLTEHAERGEERFQVAWNSADDTVTYSIRAFFRPSRPSIWLAWPYLYRKVNQFRYDSAEAMRRAIAERAACQEG